MNSVVIIAARMGSTRLPGKSLADLGGQPMLRWVCDRAAASRFLTVTAIPDTPENDGLAEAIASWGYKVFRGPEADVLGRLCVAADALHADRVIRITGDCPLIDADLIVEAERRLEPGRIAYVSNTVRRTFAKGLDVEAIEVGLLAAAYRVATKGYDREHVTPWIQRFVGRRRLGMTVTQEDVGEQDWQWSVDTPEDLVWVNRMTALYRTATGTTDLPSAAWLRGWLREHPSDLHRHRPLVLVR